MRCLWIGAIAGCLGWANRAAAEDVGDGPVEPDEMSGIERPAQHPAEPIRYLTNGLLWPFRLTIDFLFLASGTAGGLIENEQIVPRVRDAFFTTGGHLGVFPTFFLETGSSPNVGARFVANLEPFAATMRTGYGGRDANVAETRLRLSVRFPQPGIISFEALHDRRTGLGFSGVGQTPATDARNHFLVPAPNGGSFRERRERLVAGLGFRPLENFEVLFSSSLTQRYIDDPADAVPGTALTEVFAPASIPAAFTTMQITYTELALRLDTRSSRAGGDVGALLEVYNGVGAGIHGTSSTFGRAGFQTAGFFSFIRPSSILSPKITVDAIGASDTAHLPFIELVGQPTFRGVDNRRDNLSVVASLDYRWYLMRFVGARLFGDLAHVFPTLSGLALTHWRWVTGFGFDLSSSTTELGSIAFAFGPDGYNFFFALGLPARFGDRQHRD
jgi:hypothetical protein